jgi:NADH dehydrogenase
MHVVVLGGGYAGLMLTRRLERSLPVDADLTLVDERETHLVQHLVHRAVRKPSLADRLTVPFDRLCSRADHHRASVTGLDRETRTVETTGGTLSYDVCAVCLGAQTAFYGLPGVRTHATPLKRLDHAARIREGFDRVRERGGRVVVGGAGLSGVQVAGELAELAAAASADPEVLLVERSDTVAPGFSEPFRAAIADELDARGVTVRTGTAVEEATADAVVLDGESVACDQLVWTGGITGRDAVSERRRVRATLRDGDRVFALGDAAQAVDAEGAAVPATAQTAVRQAGVAATNITRLVGHLDDGGGGFEPRMERYRYDSKGWAVSVGDGTVARVDGAVVRGAPAHLLKTTIGSGYLGAIGAVSDAVGYALTT